MNREQQQVIEYLLVEIQVLREMIPKKRLRSTEKQRLRLTAEAKCIRFSKLKEIASAAAPETLMNRIRMGIAKSMTAVPSVELGVRRPKRAAGILCSGWRRRIRIEAIGKESRKVWGMSSEGQPSEKFWQRQALFPHRNGQELEGVSEGQLECHGYDGLLHVELLRLFGCERYSVMMVMELATRRVQIAGIVSEPTGQWIEQVGRGLVDGFGGFLRGKKHENG